MDRVNRVDVPALNNAEDVESAGNAHESPAPSLTDTGGVKSEPRVNLVDCGFGRPVST